MELTAGRNSGTTRPRFVQTEPENIPDDEDRGIHCLDKYSCGSLMETRGVAWIVDCLMVVECSVDCTKWHGVSILLIFICF